MNCIKSYTDEELKKLKEKSTKRAQSKVQKWKKKNSDYYAAQRQDYYEMNKDKIMRKKSEYRIKNKNSIKIKNAEYYKKTKDQRKYITKFYYEMNKISLKYEKAPWHYNEVYSGFHIRCYDMEERFGTMLENLKKEHPKYKEKTIKFLDHEINSTITWLKDLLEETFKKFESCWKKYDEEYKQDIFFALHNLIGVRLAQVKSLLNAFHDGGVNENITRKHYLADKDESIDEYNDELLQMKKRTIQRAQDTLQDKLQISQKMLPQKYPLLWNRKKDGTEIVSYFKNQNLNQEMIDILEMLEELMAKTIRDVESQIKESAADIGELICQWDENTKKWREKRDSDLMLINDTFESLTCFANDEGYKLWHKLQLNIEYICKTCELQPPKELEIDDFIRRIKELYEKGCCKCDDPNCICILIRE